jgi:ubiquinone/menaquinone biosynthesis C-methylase UbiE
MIEQYTHGHHRSVVTAHSARRASEAAAFLLPLLKSPMRLLDFGCGPGTITVDLAEKLKPGGSVVGIDMSEEVIAQAREHARSSGVSNVRFDTGNIYETGFDEGSFDVVYAHQVLHHLSGPVKALAEAKRVLKPGGICGVREVDWGTSAIWPTNSRLERFLEIFHEVERRNGGDADAGRHLKDWFEQAGFSDLKVTASTWAFAEQAGLEWWGTQWSERIVHSNIATSAVKYGIATQAELEDISKAWLEWMAAPGAFFSFIHAEVIGTKR